LYFGGDQNTCNYYVSLLHANTACVLDRDQSACGLSAAAGVLVPAKCALAGTRSAPHLLTEPPRFDPDSRPPKSRGASHAFPGRAMRGEVAKAASEFERKLLSARACAGTHRNSLAERPIKASEYAFAFRVCDGRRSTAFNFQPGRNVLKKTMLALGALFVAVAFSTAAKAQANPNPIGVDPEHYQCYTIAKIDPVFADRGVRLKDQFGLTSTKVIAPKLLCAPVSKNGELLADTRSHLVCYSLRASTPTPVNKRVEIVNQFGKLQFDVGIANLLCVPSLKRVLPAPK
jgi:hypothetical protein